MSWRAPDGNELSWSRQIASSARHARPWGLAVVREPSRALSRPARPSLAGVLFRDSRTRASRFADACGVPCVASVAVALEQIAVRSMRTGRPGKSVNEGRCAWEIDAFETREDTHFDRTLQTWPVVLSSRRSAASPGQASATISGSRRRVRPPILVTLRAQFRRQTISRSGPAGRRQEMHG